MLRFFLQRGVAFTEQLWLRRGIATSIPALRTLAASEGNDAGDKIYELRTYAVQPSKFSEFLRHTEEYYHLRTAHSKLIGYWTTKLGGENEVVHLWEYGEEFYSEHLIIKLLRLL